MFSLSIQFVCVYNCIKIENTKTSREGLVMAKKEKNKICPICENKLGFLKHEFADGIRVCGNCFISSGITLSEIAQRGQKNISIEEIKDRINVSKQVKDELEQFTATKSIGNAIAFDDENKLIMISPKKHARVYDYNHISSFELLEDGEIVTSGGLGRALVGGALFGGTGAIVGGVTGNRKNKEKISSLRIKLSLKDINYPVDYVDFLSMNTKRGSLIYKVAYNEAQECLSALQYICDQEKSTKQHNSSNSAADEIMKYKNLLDAGAITQEEFDYKKKELLGL